MGECNKIFASYSPTLYNPSMDFELVTPYKPKGDQPRAIEELVAGVDAGEKHQVLLGVTGSGKTFTMAKVIEQLNRPALILAHNKTLAAQLYHEFKQFFPRNAVEYFVSYYDYYQPEATFRPATFTSKRKPPSTKSWTSCVWRPRAAFLSGAMWSLSARSAASTASVRRRPTTAC